MTRVWRPSDDAVATEVEGGAVVLNVRTKRYYSLNVSGSVIWQAIEHGASEEEIVAALRSRFAVDEPDATRATERVVRELQEEALIVAATREST